MGNSKVLDGVEIEPFGTVGFLYASEYEAILGRAPCRKSE